MKFGGTSVADADRIRTVADYVARTVHHGNQVVVAVSAMGKEPDELLHLARQVPRTHPGRPVRGPTGQLQHHGSDVTQEQRRPAYRWGGPDPTDTRQCPPHHLRVELLIDDTHRVNVAGVYRQRPTDVCSAAAAVR